MGKMYAIDFGFDMGEAILGGTANMQWGMAVSTDGGSNWEHFDQRQAIDKDSEVIVSIFNTSDSRGQLNAVIDSGGTISSVKADDAPGDQRDSAPWSATPSLSSGTPTPGGTSAGLDLQDLPGMQLCSFTAANEGHFAVTLELTVDGHDYDFRVDPELVIGGHGG